MNLTLINQDTETYTEEHGETGGPEANLGREFSRQATFATDNPDRPYMTVTLTAFITGTVEDGRGNPVRDAGHDDLNIKSLGLVRPSTIRYDAEHLLLWENVEESAIFHTEPTSPEDSEVHTEVEYWGLGHIFQPSIAASEDYCRRYIDAVDFRRDYSAN